MALARGFRVLNAVRNFMVAFWEPTMTFETPRSHETNMSYLSKTDSYSSTPFWQNGPAPGALYNFPGPTAGLSGGFQHSQ